MRNLLLATAAAVVAAQPYGPVGPLPGVVGQQPNVSVPIGDAGCGTQHLAHVLLHLRFLEGVFAIYDADRCALLPSRCRCTPATSP